MATLIAHVVKGPHTIFKGFFTYFKKLKKLLATNWRSCMIDLQPGLSSHTHIESNIITVLILILIIINYDNQITFYYCRVLSKISLYMYKHIYLHKSEDNNHIEILGTNEQSSVHSHLHHTLLQLYN